jgi:intracellular septation protein
LEYGPLIAFFVIYFLIKDDTITIMGADYSGFIVATAVFIPILVASTGLGWALSGEISKMQVVTVVLVVVFGGLTVFLQDERFFKIKPTMIYLLFAGILGFGLWRGTSYLETVMGANLKMERAGWMILTKRMTWFFLGLAVANEAIWRTQSTETWVMFKTFGLTVATFAFLMSQYKLFALYGDLDDKDD